MKRKKSRGRAKKKMAPPVIIVFFSRAGIKRPKKGK